MRYSLDSLESTHDQMARNRDTGNGFHFVGRVYPSGDAECTALQLNSDDQIRKGGGAKRKNNNKNQMSDITLNKSSSRARSMIRRKVLSIMADHMMTLTFKENLTDLNAAWLILAKFIRMVQKEFKGEFQYICVPEFQKRGAVHFHMAVVGRQNLKMMRVLWYKAVGEFEGKPNGQINVRAPLTKNGKKIKEPSKIANYLTKYITKCDAVKFNKKKYSSGGKIVIPPSLTGWMALGLPIEAVLSKVMQALTIKETKKVIQIDSYFQMAYITT